MRTQRSIHRKAAKSRARRRDFLKRRNINRNVPTIDVGEKVDLFKPVTVTVPGQPYSKSARKRRTRERCVVKQGLAQVHHVGYKTRSKKIPICRMHVKGNVHEPIVDQYNRVTPMVAYPKRRKFVNQ